MVVNGTFFIKVGLPEVIQTDQGSKFMSMLFRQVVKQLAIKASGYHPQSQGVFKRFHSTMSNMMQTYCLNHQKEWDEGIPFLMFVVRESAQLFLGFSPFDIWTLGTRPFAIDKGKVITG